MTDIEKRVLWFAKRDKVQAKVGKPHKSRGNRGEYYKYPDLIDAFLPVMREYGLSIIHGEIWHEASRSWTITMEIIDMQTGWSESDRYHIINESNTNQGHGAAHTYGKRYMFCNLIGFQFGEEDDDGERGRQSYESKQQDNRFISPSSVHKIYTKVKNMGDRGQELKIALRNTFGISDWNRIPVEYEEGVLKLLQDIE